MLIELPFCQQSLFWPGPSICYSGTPIEFVITLQLLSILTSIVDKLYKVMEDDAIRRHFVVFAYFHTKVKGFFTWLKVYLYLKGYSGDVIMVMSLQDKEQKMHHADFFLNDAPDLSHPVDNRIFHAIACLATHSISTTGWD